MEADILHTKYSSEKIPKLIQRKKDILRSLVISPSLLLISKIMHKLAADKIDLIFLDIMF